MSSTTRRPRRTSTHRTPALRAAGTGLAALALGLTGALAAAPTATAAAPDGERAKLVRTEFAFKANGYGTSASGGQIPVGSDRTALSSIACTSDAGKARRNFVEETEVPGLGTVRGVYSRVSTSRKGGVTASTSVHKVAEIVLADTPLGSLTIDGVESTTSASNDGRAFDAVAETKIAGITFTPPVGEPQTLPIPSLGQPLEIPGLAVITAHS